MITNTDLESLREFRATAGTVLSVYLDLDQSRAANLNRGFERTLESNLRTARAGIEGITDVFDACADRVRAFIALLRPQSRSLALFVSETGSLWWHEFDVPVSTDVRWGETAFIQPFIEAMDESKTYAVLLVNRSRARILTVNMGNIVERAKLQSNDGVRHIKTTGTDHLYSQSHFQRRADEHALSSFKNVVEALERIAIAHPFERLILSGSTQAATEVFRLLPKPLQAKVIAFATIPVGASEREILERTMEVERDAERAFELGRIESLITAAAKGTRAVTGMENTLKALADKRVHELVYAEGFNGDVVERALNLALSENARIEQVRGDAAARLKTAGGIGAFVRWDS